MNTLPNEKPDYGCNDCIYLKASRCRLWQIKINDNSGNMLSDAYIHGPYGGGTALVKGQLYDMGDMAKEFAKLTSSEHIQVEFAETGTGPDIDGLTFVIVYIKTA